ncbi:MAG TPA: hypothetical protein VM534_07540 [Thermoanaerobaculia bacterium]|nr:hypothetical protein [Thermoanaerobaculia bacterium]
MPANDRENTRNKGFWDGGRSGHGTARESGGRSSGYPGRRETESSGIQIDLDRFAPPQTPSTHPASDIEP